METEETELKDKTLSALCDAMNVNTIKVTKGLFPSLLFGVLMIVLYWQFLAHQRELTVRISQLMRSYQDMKRGLNDCITQL